jgi:ABC-type multidrug transport system ATPase subunit
MPNIVCSAESISKSFGKFKALNGVSVELYEQEIFGLLGSNGAGKSTLAKIMTGLLDADAGKINYFGLDLKKDYNELKKRLTVVPQEISCYHGFTVEDNIRFFGLMHKIRGKALDDKVEYLLEWLPLKKFRHKAVNELSGGYKRMVNIACSLVHDPKMIFLDEPSAGLDPKMRHILWEKITELKKSGKTICLTTHYLDEAQALCDRVALLVSGEIVIKGIPEELIKQHGGYRVLILKLNKVVPQEIRETIKKVFKESQVDAIDNTILVSFDQKHSIEKISVLTRWLIKQGYEVTNSVVKEPELEDVFMNITGDKLRG